MRKILDALKTTFLPLTDGKSSFVVEKQGEEIVFKQKQNPTVAERLLNCELISNYLIDFLKKLNFDSLTIAEFQEVRSIVDEHYVYVKHMTRLKGLSRENILYLRAQTLSIKLGGKVEIAWLMKEENQIFWQFIVKNYFQHDFFALRFQLPFDAIQGPSIPVKMDDFSPVFIPFSRIKIEKSEDQEKLLYSFEGKLLFESGLDYVLGEDYSCLYKGIQKYNIFTSPEWIPYDKRDPKEWKNRFQLEVWTSHKRHYVDRPSMFSFTHAFMVLKDDQGFIRSVGQDAMVDFHNYKLLELLSRKPGYGKIATPDQYVFYPTNARSFWFATIPITKEEHDKIIQIVERDKQNRLHSMSVMKKNCVSYTVRILREALGFNINASLNGIHVFFKSLLPDQWYRGFMRMFTPWYQNQSPIIQKLAHYFPLFYLVCLFASIVARIIQQNSYLGERDFRLWEVLCFPWKLEVDHPLSLHRSLEKLVNEEGEIHLAKEPATPDDESMEASG